jgi:V-type H+-transporting ATPase subunit E
MASAQIQQMSNFILQESHEKANEIRLKGEHDFNLEKQGLIHQAKLKVIEDISKKAKEAEVQQRIAVSTAVGSANVTRMEYRKTLLQNLSESATQRLTLVAGDTNYKSLLQKLIVQSLIKIEENDLTIYCRAGDVKLDKTVLPDAIKEYTALMLSKTKLNLVPNIKHNDDGTKHLPESCCGGIILTALDGRLVLDNTLESRLKICIQELEPCTREILFPMAARVANN